METKSQKKRKTVSRLNISSFKPNPCISFIHILGESTYTVKYDSFCNMVISGFSDIEGNHFYPPGTEYDGFVVPPTRILLTGCKAVLVNIATKIPCSESVDVLFLVDISGMSFGDTEPAFLYKSWCDTHGNEPRLLFPEETLCYVRALPSNKKAPEALRKMFKFSFSLAGIKTMIINFTFVIYEYHAEQEGDQLKMFTDILGQHFNADALC